MKINRELLPLKGHYFFFNAGTAPLYPTMPVYAKQLGLSGVVVGTIYTIFPLCGIIAKPIVGAVGDRFKAHKMLLIACEVLILLSYFAIQFVPPLPKANVTSVNVTCMSQTTFEVCPRGARQRGIANHILSLNASVDCQLECAMPRHETTKTCGLCSPHHPYRSAVQNELDLSDVKPGLPKHHHHSSAISLFNATLDVPRMDIDGECMILNIENAIFANRTVIRPICANQVHAHCLANCSSRSLNRLMRDAAINDADVPSYWQFWLFFVLLFISWVSTTVSVSLTDTICVEVLGRQTGKFGNQRLWGSTGWGILSIVSGFVVDAFSDKNSDLKNYTPSFYMMGVLLLCDIFSSNSIKYEQSKSSKNFWKDVGRLFLNIRIVVFMVWCTSIGMCFGMVWNFLFWYMEELADIQGGDALAYIKTIEGLVGGIHCFAGEVPSYFLSGWVLEKIGHGHAMTLTLLLAGVRFILYSIISDPWWVLPVSCFQAMNGLFFPTMTSYAKIVAEPGTEATVQGLVSALCEGVGVALGSFLGGIFVDSYGGATAFRIFGIAILVIAVFNAVAQFLLEKFGKKESLEETLEKTKLKVGPVTPVVQN